MDGVLIIDKPRGLTSHDVVVVARRCLGEKRIGHTGTLDPLATGVLALACGRATRLVRFLSAADKDYRAGIRFGVTTDTYDITGEELTRSESRPTRDAVERAVGALRGDYHQMPPAYSAKKVAGRKAYSLARRDEAVTLAPVPVKVTRADVLSFDGERAQIALTCSAGFYVRTFAHELGQRVGCGATLESLQRTRSGSFSLDGAVDLGALQAGPETAADVIVPLDRLLDSFPTARLTDEGRRRVAHGQAVRDADVFTATSSAVEAAEPAEPWVRLLDTEGHLVAMATRDARSGSLHPAVVLIYN